MENFLSKLRIKAYDTLNDTLNYLITKYKVSYRQFTYASPYFQILQTLNNHMQNMYYYLQDALNQSNFETANRQHTVFGLARLQGHNAYRGKSAVGQVILRVKPDFKRELMSGNTLYIPNYSKILCLDNGLSYLVNIGSDYCTFNIEEQKQLKLPIIEGTIESQVFTGTGEDIQTFECQASQWQMFDHDFVHVRSNGQYYEQYDSLYDIPYKTRGCLVKTGMSSGIDIIFGKSINAIVPQLGEEIIVDYLISSGSVGNIMRDNPTWEMNDTCFDSLGNEISMKDIFYCDTLVSPRFGADAEDMNLTKILAPNISRNFIIHDKRSIEYFLRRMNYFSIIKIFKRAIDHINEYSLILIPKIKNRLVSGEDYFSMDINKILLSEQEKSTLLEHINQSGRKSANVSITLGQPDIKRFVMYVFLEVHKTLNHKSVNEDDVRAKVRTSLNQYFLNNDRVNKIPHSDIVALLDDMLEIDTVKVVFIGDDGTDSIDDMGNISVADTEVAVIRGGWTDDNGVHYADEYDPVGDTLGSVNVSIDMI